MRTAGFREEHLAGERREQGVELLGVAILVEEVGTEDEIPGRGSEQRFRLVPADARRAQGDAVALGVSPEQLDRLVRPVRGHHPRTATRRCERREAEPAAKLEYFQSR